MTELVLVTGAYGFIASHCILQLLEQGYRVRGSLRNLEGQEPGVRAIVSRAGAPNDQLELVHADLLDDQGWDRAVQGCSYVLHVASPVNTGVPRSKADCLIRPARGGTLRILKAAAAAGVHRVIMTSSIAAIVDGHTNNQKIFDENDWTNLDGNPRAYGQSKTLAERAAWDFMEQLELGNPLELVVINPAYVYGPLLDPRHTSSASLFIRMLTRKYPGCTQLHFPLVDVRDVALAHLLAMTLPVADGERFCCVSGGLWMDEIAAMLNKHFSARGYPVHCNVLPRILVNFFSLFDSEARELLPTLGVEWRISNQKILEVLNWKPRPTEEIIIDTAESLIRWGLV